MSGLKLCRWSMKKEPIELVKLHSLEAIAEKLNAPGGRQLDSGSTRSVDKRESQGEMSSGRKWTAEEDDRLLELKATGKSLSVIADELNRTQAAIDSRTNHLKEMKSTLGLKAKGK